MTQQRPALQFDPRFIEACREFNRVLVKSVGDFTQRLADEMKKVKMPPVERWFENSRDYWACHPSWRRVPGGRASHAFYDGSDVPLCGVRAVRSDGHTTRWRPAQTNRWGADKRHHRECERLAQVETERRKRALIERQRQELREETHQ